MASFLYVFRAKIGESIMINLKHEESEIQVLTHRIGKIERCQRINHAIYITIILGMVFALPKTLVNSAHADKDNSEVYKVEGLLLVDKLGKQRGSWLISDDGDTILTLNDKNENPLLVMMVGKNGHTEYGMFDQDGNTRSSWAVGTSKDIEFSLHDPKGAPRFLIMNNRNVTALSLIDSNGKTRSLWSNLNVGNVNKVELGFYDLQMRKRLTLTVVKEGIPALLFPDESNPMNVKGGWWALKDDVVRIPKGSLLKALGQ